MLLVGVVNRQRLERPPKSAPSGSRPFLGVLMKLAATLIVCSMIFTSNLAAAQSRTSVLFIGNSFTYAQGSPVHFYRAATVTDLNAEGVGGVPALFKSFADQAGLDYDVSLETRGGTGLDFHLAEKSGVIGTRGWDVVVM